jgi:hypothetical protein
MNFQVILKPTASISKVPEWYVMETTKNFPAKNLRIKIAMRMDKPQNMKHCGYDKSYLLLALFSQHALYEVSKHLQLVEEHLKVHAYSSENTAHNKQKR